MAQLSMRIDDKVKKKAELACEALGMSMTTAINLYLVKLGNEMRIPFEVSIDPFYASENLKILDWFGDMEIPAGQLSMEFNLKLKDSYLAETINIFDQRSTNEGFLYLLFYFTLVISDETPRFFAIENIDTAFNPKLCREVIKRLVALAKKHGKQIIATTHNPAILDGLDLNDDEQKLMVVQRSTDGYTKVRTLRKDETVNSDLSLSQLWLRGFIGGLPNNF